MTALEVLGGTEALNQALEEEQKHQLDLDIIGKTIDEVEASKDYQQIIKQKDQKQKLFEYEMELQKEMDKDEVEGDELGDELEDLKLAVTVASQALDDKKDSTDAILAVRALFDGNPKPTFQRRFTITSFRSQPCMRGPYEPTFQQLFTSVGLILSLLIMHSIPCGACAFRRTARTFQQRFRIMLINNV